MTDDTSRVPKLRFPGFAGAWEQRKLRDYLVPSKEKNSALSYGKDEVLSVSGDAGVVNQIQFQGRSYAGASTKDYGVVQTGDVIYTKSPLKKNPFGIIKTNKGKAGIVSTLYAVYKPKDNTYTPFVEVYFDDDARLNNYLRPLVNKGAKNDMKVSKSGALTGLICFPGATEQRMLSEFFQQLEDLITLHQRKLSHLRQLKKGLLQKMFPKSGEDRPEVRFPGFADAWEQRKLSDLFIEGGSGGTPKSTNKAFYDGDIPFLGISDITKSNGFINNTEKHISSDGLNSSAAWIVSKGAISLAMYASVGKLAILNIDAATSQAFYNMIFDDYDLRDLVYQRLNKANELSEWNKLISTGTQSNLNADKVKNFQMYLPKNHDEIKLISTFFKQIDNTIDLHQRKQLNI